MRGQSPPYLGWRLLCGVASEGARDYFHFGLDYVMVEDDVHDGVKSLPVFLGISSSLGSVLEGCGEEEGGGGAEGGGDPWQKEDDCLKHVWKKTKAKSSHSFMCSRLSHILLI